MMLRALVFTSLLLVATSAPGLAAPFKITSDCIVEGSSKHGGIQPDYLIRPKDDPWLQKVLYHAARIGRRDIDYFAKVSKVRSLVRGYLRHGEYDNPKYRDLCSTYTEIGEPVPLGEYVRSRVGVCRENYLLLHLALLQAGIPNEAVYAKIEQFDHDKHVIEDHGFVVLRGGPGDGLTVDSYNKIFNGVRFGDLKTPNGVDGSYLPAKGFAEPVNAKRRVLAVHDFPTVHPLDQLGRALQAQ